ncbi:hypothetical protein [Photobacterium rosenbergii]|uniref:GNAT family acetyltransferase n=2 Tax=Photobacterium TaxID=657 RepID=A0ABU3ZI08_9GAMM|nr:hypothetical protein [Photobacterium rosenbergii]MDV5169747.1 hypothetical protein [Photobacterium rosenbergii]
MEKIFSQLLTVIHFFAALILIAIALITMVWSVYEIIIHLLADNKEEFLPLILQSIGATIIAAAIVDVARYMIEEDVFHDKELRDPEEARRTITKIMVIISIAVSIEGLVYIFKAGTEDLHLLIYPACLILVSSISVVALGLYQRLSIDIEKKEGKGIIMQNDYDADNTTHRSFDDDSRG